MRHCGAEMEHIQGGLRCVKCGKTLLFHKKKDEERHQERIEKLEQLSTLDSGEKPRKGRLRADSGHARRDRQ